MTRWSEILKASKGLHARDSFSEMWGLKVKANKAEWPEITITGTLPLTYTSRAEHALKNYTVYGTSAGAGVETVNLFDKDAKDTNNGYVAANYLLDDGSAAGSTSWNISEYIEVEPNTAYSLYLKASGTYPSLCEYDSTKAYINGRNYLTNISISFTTSSTAKYLRISYKGQNATDVMLTPGSTAPSTYIPYGFQIPLTDTGENLWQYKAGLEVGYLNINGAVTRSVNWRVSPFIDISGTTKVYIFNNNNSGDAPSICFYDSEQQIISGVAYQGRHNFSVIVPNNTKYCKVCVFADNYYEFVLTTNAATYPLYIGDSKLGEEEYVDYGEGKIYKRTENLFNKNAKDPDNGFVSSRYISPDGNTGSSKYYDISEYMPIQSQATYYVYGFPGSSSYACAFYDNQKSLISATAYTNANRLEVISPQNAAYIRITIFKNATSTMVLPETSETYIPYLQPTDPPAPFPAITAYAGENTLSSTETVGECSVTGRIKSV